MKKWFEIINKHDRAEIWIYEQIGEDFWSGDGITAKSFQKELAGVKASQIDLHINSPGGEVWDGLSIYNLIKQHPAKVTTYIDGIAASIASVIALAGDKVIMAENAMYMMHNPYGSCCGNAEELRQMADVLDKVSGSIALAYQGKTGKPDDEIKALMDAETWMTADEAHEMGFCDEIAEQMDMAACAKFVPAMQQAKFKNIPMNLTGDKKPPNNERDLEKLLRDAGYSRKETKSIISCGFKGILRDAEQPEIPQVAETLRDAEQPKPAKKDRVSDLLIRAEIIAPTQTN
jgi:ATP-dependent Clp endopeptidase proteolytic subunit ClpP